MIALALELVNLKRAIKTILPAYQWGQGTSHGYIIPLNVPEAASNSLVGKLMSQTLKVIYKLNQKSATAPHSLPSQEFRRYQWVQAEYLSEKTFSIGEHV